MKTFAGLLASASLVAGHGYVTNATIGNSAYTFYQPYTDPYTSPIPERVSREIQGNGPVTSLTYSDLQCGGYTDGGINGSSPAALTATVAAGSTVDLYWTLWPESHVGPSLTYLAKCANNDCTTYMPGTDAVWFKVQETGRTGTSDVWGTTQIMTAGGFISYTIPECIEAGQYLVRHEVIALHSAYEAGGAQFYPGCHQITVTGGGSTTPSGLVAFPGAYSSADPGITYDAYKATEYTIPGPALFSCSGSSSSSSESSASASSASAPAAATSTAAATTSVDANVAVATPTAAAAADDDDETCAEETVTSTSSAAQATATAAASDDETCAEETATSTSSAAQATATAAASGDDETCGDESDDGSDSTATTGAATGSDSSADADDCDAEEEQAYARRFTGRFARGL